MILQIGSLFSGLGGFLTSAIGTLAERVLPQAVNLGQSLLERELFRGERRKQKAVLKAQVREQSNLLGQGPAVPSTSPVPTGGRTFQPVGLISNIVPPGISGLSIRPAGLRAGPVDRLASRALRGMGRFPAAARLLGPIGGAAALPGATAPLPNLFGQVFPQGPSRLFFPPSGRQLNGAPSMANGNGVSVFQRNARGGVQHFVLGASGCLEPIETATEINGARFRLDLSDQMFKKIKPRRINPLNFKALGRARRRTGAALRVCRTMFTEARREKTGRIRPKGKAKRK